jgi:hypothetical protein
MNTLILDTNAYNRYIAGESAILDAIRQADIVSLSIFVLGELLCGFKRGTRERGKRLLLRKFLGGAKFRILEETGVTSGSPRKHSRPAPCSSRSIRTSSISPACGSGLADRGSEGEYQPRPCAFWAWGGFAR